ncbi:MAG: hypothetical protein HY719_13730 [Planctomycetes bacterium]|nr:hypothetical protein [Planctomycetota bacterium]
MAYSVENRYLPCAEVVSIGAVAAGVPTAFSHEFTRNMVVTLRDVQPNDLGDDNVSAVLNWLRQNVASTLRGVPGPLLAQSLWISAGGRVFYDDALHAVQRADVLSGTASIFAGGPIDVSMVLAGIRLHQSDRDFRVAAWHQYVWTAFLAGVDSVASEWDAEGNVTKHASPLEVLVALYTPRAARSVLKPDLAGANKWDYRPRYLVTEPFGPVAIPTPAPVSFPAPTPPTASFLIEEAGIVPAVVLTSSDGIDAPPQGYVTLEVDGIRIVGNEGNAPAQAPLGNVVYSASGGLPTNLAFPIALSKVTSLTGTYSLIAGTPPGPSEFPVLSMVLFTGPPEIALVRMARKMQADNGRLADAHMVAYFDSIPGVGGLED